MLGNRYYVEFEKLSNKDKTLYVFGSELWWDNFERLSKGVHCSHMGDAQTKLYGTDSCPSQTQSQPSAGDRGPVAGVVGMVSKLGKSDHSRGELRECHEGDIFVHVINNMSVCGSTPSLGYVVNGSIAKMGYYYDNYPFRICYEGSQSILFSY